MFHVPMLIPVNESGCVQSYTPGKGIFNEITLLDPVPHMCCTRLKSYTCSTNMPHIYILSTGFIYNMPNAQVYIKKWNDEKN